MFRRIWSHVMVFLAGVLLASFFHPLDSVPTFAQGGCRTFPETGKTVCGRFLQYWQQNGGLAQQGFPISNEFVEVSDLNGKPYTVQYFERAVFEKHPENAPPYDVLLSQLGTFQFRSKYPNGAPAGGQTSPTAQPAQAPGSQFQVLQTNRYADSISDNNYVGVIRYTGSATLGSPRIVATLTDANGKVLDTATTYPGISLVRPNSLIPFRTLFDLPAPTGSKISTSIEAAPASNSQLQSGYLDLNVAQSKLTPGQRESEPTKIVGTIGNTGAKTATDVHIIAAIYDGSGKLLDVSNAYAALTDIPSGGTSAFEISSYSSRGAARYDLVVTGRVK
jgi:hypothetical protein